MKLDNTRYCAAHAPLAIGPLSEHVVSFNSHLQEHHHAPTTVHRVLSGLAHFLEVVFLQDTSAAQSSAARTGDILGITALACIEVCRQSFSCGGLVLVRGLNSL